LEILILVALVFCFFLIGLPQRLRYNSLKKRGKKVKGVMIANREKSGANGEYQLGGNFNRPTVRFLTEEGLVVTGTPVMDIVTQHELVPPVMVTVYYDARRPSTFCITLAP